MKSYSSLLIHTPTFLEGAGRTLDIGGQFDTNLGDHAAPEELDRIGLTSDWYAIMSDLRKSINEFVARRRGEAADDTQEAAQ